MESRERLLAILNKEKSPDRAGWSPLVDGYFMSSFSENKDIIDVFKEIKADLMERHVFTWSSSFENKKIGLKNNKNNVIEISENGVRIKEELRKVKKGIEIIRQYEIPGHVLTSRSIYTKESPFIPFPLEYAIKTPEDMEAYVDIKNKEKYVRKYSRFIKEDLRIGNIGIATDTAPTTPVQEIIQHLTGIEKFYTKFLLDYRKKLEELMEVMHEKNLEVYRIVADSPSKIVINYENTSTTLVSPEIYEKYSLQYINDYSDILHSKDKIYLTHRCGKLKGLIDLLKKGKDDGIIDISPKPTGDLDIWDAQELWPDKIVQGGLDPTTLTHWTIDRLKDYVRMILDKTDSHERLIIGTADATPKNAKLENLIVVGEVLGGDQNE